MSQFHHPYTDLVLHNLQTRIIYETSQTPTSATSSFAICVNDIESLSWIGNALSSEVGSNRVKWAPVLPRPIKAELQIKCLLRVS